jgi:hypothetical protein
MSQYVTIPSDPLKLNKLNIKCTYNNKNYNLVVSNNQVFLMDEATIASLKSSNKFTGNNEFIILPIGETGILASVTGNPTNQQTLMSSSVLINSTNNNFVTIGGNISTALVTLNPSTTQNTFTFTLSFTIDKSIVTKDKDGKDITTSTKKIYYVGITDQKPSNITDDVKLYDFLYGYENINDPHVLNFSVGSTQQNYMIYIIIIIILLILLCCCCSSFFITNK